MLTTETFALLKRNRNKGCRKSPARRGVTGSSGAPRAGPGRHLRVPRSTGASRRTSERRAAGHGASEPGPSIPTKPRSAPRSCARRRCALPPSRGGRGTAPMGRPPPGRRRGSRPRAAPALPLSPSPVSRLALREARPPRRLRAGGRGAADPARVGSSGVGRHVRGADVDERCA